MTSPPETKPDGAKSQTAFVGDYLLYLLAAVSDRASGEFHAHVRASGLRVPEWRVLACLMDEDGAMVTHLARLSLFEQSRLTKTIDQMVDRGLVRRAPDPDDARRVRVYLTEAGRHQASGLMQDAKVHEGRILQGLTSDEAHMIKPVLRKILRHLEIDSHRG